MKKLKSSIKSLEKAFKYYDEDVGNDFYFAGLSKSFETCLEYAWKYFKQRAAAEGLEVYSPKEAIKHAGRLGIIDNVEAWLDYLKDRNLAVHDYMGMEDAEYLETMRAFLKDIRKITIKG